jgi:putative spermidine/putrescine transport system ATP-binding protein/mannopine transport system ATP-binding protein
VNAPPAKLSKHAGTTVGISGLYKSYGPVRAVNGVSMEIKPGEFVALLGPSGSGKTTILMTIAGFETPDAGTISIGGVDVTAVAPSKRDIGMVFQRYALFPHMTVEENIAFPLKMRGIKGRPSAERVEGALAMVRLDRYGKRRISQLSGGQQQRVALARALVYNPPVLLMDEPLGALDKNLREEMQLEIKHLQQLLGTTVVYVTHDQGEALTMADRIAVVHDGVVQQFAPPEEIYERPANAFVAGFVGEINFIGGRLVTEARKWRFNIAGAPELIDLAGVKVGDDWTDGAVARLTIRPEQIRIAPAMETAGLPGILVETIYAGGTLACVVELASGARVTARIASADRPMARAGDAIRIVWPINRGQVFVE